MHLGIDLTLRVGFFSYALFVLYIAFLPPEAVSATRLRTGFRTVPHDRRAREQAPGELGPERAAARAGRCNRRRSQRLPLALRSAAIHGQLDP